MSEESRKVVPLRAATTPTTAPLPPFADLLRNNLDTMYRLATYIVASPEDARDVVQNAAMNAFRGYASVRDGATAKVWLLRVLVNAARDHLRARARAIDVVDIPVEAVLDEALSSELVAMERRLLERGSLIEAFSSLELPFREVVWQIDGEGMTTQEVAEILALPVGTVASRLYRGRRKLRERLTRGGS